ncbi:MAG: HAMP domain-containing protein [Thiothrix sp.]|nr:HAMP domain-containing protein [Thiothrix sp.]HPQ95894.1 ATP-binding protein [Thiolinea sp.]
MPRFLLPSFLQQLNQRFLVFLFSVLGLASFSFLLLFYFFYNAQLAAERTEASQAVSLLLKSSLERAMLQRDLPGLRAIVDELGRQDKISDVRILNPSGEIRFASRPDQLGQQAIDLMQSFCGECDPDRMPLEPQARFVTVENGSERLRTFHPVRNKPECMQCHGSTVTHPVNGILLVDHEAASIRHKGLTNILTLAGAGGIVMLLTAMASWWFMRRYVMQPIGQLNQASRHLSQGNLDTRVNLPPGQDEMTRLAGAFNHMAERLQHNHDLLQSRQQFLQGLIDAMPDGVRVIAPDYRIVQANRSYAEQAGYATPQALCRQYCYQVTYQRDTPCPPTLRTCPLSRLNQDQPTLRYMETLQRRDGSSLMTEVFAARLPPDAHPDHPGNTADDFLVVEAVRDLEKVAHYSHEQKLAALGELAANVAHEIHNPLASVQITLQASERILAESGQDTHELGEYLQLVNEQVEQCLDVTHRLMKLGTLASVYPELLDVNTLIRETLSLLRFEREQQGITEQLQLDSRQPRIVAADNDLRMVILNLVQNAFHAMPDGGVLTVATGKEAGQVLIRVADTGQGIRNESLPYIFDPFFSQRPEKTRPGTGLGLTIVRSLVRQHDGTIRVAHHQPGNTVFEVRFPDADSPTEEN